MVNCVFFPLTGLLIFSLPCAAVAIEENLGLSGSETVGVIIAIVSGATVLIVLVLITSMACRYVVYVKREY